MTNDKAVTMSRELAERIERSLSQVGVQDHLCDYTLVSDVKKELRALLAAPVVERQESVAETVPKHKFDTLVQHCKRLDADIAQARAHVNEITLYQQNAVWFWQHDGEDYLQSLSCPIIIQPHHLRQLLEGKAQHNPIAEQPAPLAHHEPVAYMRNEGTPNNLVKCTFTCPGAFGVYRKPPAPVAVVLPDVCDNKLVSTHYRNGWNACLDKVKELNQ